MSEEIDAQPVPPGAFRAGAQKRTHHTHRCASQRKNGLVTVGGIIDRVDLYKDENGTTYVRVVDYKTGRKEFKLADVLYGMSLQMLIYLAALAQNKDLHPAGILYMPAFIASVTSDGTESTEKLKQEVGKNLRMNGLLLKDNEILNAMEMGLNGRFIPVYLTKTRKTQRYGFRFK